jgi:DNA-binding GntR family transcriptional regulator
MGETPNLSFKVERTSTVDQVTDGLRRMIWEGELAPGYRLREIPLAQSLGVSRSTVRDSIRQLTQEGLIRHELHRGGVVTILAPEDVEDLYRVRKLLEGTAIMNSRKGDDGLAAVEDSVLEIERAVEREDWETAVAADREFHASLVALHESPRLSRFYEQIGVEYRFAIGVLWLDDAAGRDTDGFLAEDVARVAEEHRGIYEALAAGRRADARKALEEHLVHSRDRVIAILEARESDGSVEPS